MYFYVFLYIYIYFYAKSLTPEHVFPKDFIEKK